MSPRTLVFIAASLFGASSAWCDVQLPRLVGDNMVLQRDEPITVWGWANPGEKVEVAFQGQKHATKTNRGGNWSISIGQFAAGGPYDMTVKGRNTILLHNILVGDVWLASGQSNMEFPLEAAGAGLGGTVTTEEEIARADFPQIRLFLIQHHAAPEPAADLISQGWRSATAESVRDFSAIAYLFGRELHKKYQVPIGIIQSTWSGTPAESWMSAAGLRNFPEFGGAIRNLTSDTVRAAHTAYENYTRRKTAWYREHGSDDRGRSEGRDLWADASLDVRDWATVSLPQEMAKCGLEQSGFAGIVWFRRAAVSLPREMASCGLQPNGFAGAVWFRRVISVPAQRADKGLLLRLGESVVAQDVAVFFNGERIGQTQQMGGSLDYRVPASSVRAGSNTIAIRLEGRPDDDDDDDDLPTGVFGPRDALRAETGATVIPLDGTWSYRPGPNVEDFPVRNSKLDANPSPEAPKYSPTVLFNGMIDPMVHMRLKGVIWYQGEENAIAHRSTQYRRLFPALIHDWRAQFGYELPFLYVQLAGGFANESEPAEYPWAELREAQTRALSMPLTGMATAVDVGEEGNPHPKNKQAVAHRLVLAAAKVVYGEKIVDSGPIFESMQIEGNQVRIKFSSLGSGLQVKDKYGYARGFEVASADGKFVWAKAHQDGNDIVVFNSAIVQPVAVRYDWSNTPDGNVYNREDLPAIPFRTDAPTLSAGAQ